MTPVRLHIAVRAYAVPDRPRGDRPRRWESGWRASDFGARILALDAETTVDPYQNLQVASFIVLERADPSRYPPGYRPAGHDPHRPFRGLVMGEVLTRRERSMVDAYAEAHPIQVIGHGYARWEPRPVLTRDAFVHEVFLPEVYELGTLCVGYNLGFDLVRLAIRCTVGRKPRNRNAFRIELCEHPHHPAIYVEILSNKQALIRFSSVAPPLGRRSGPGRVTFAGRFVELRQLVYGLTGEAGDLASDCARFGVDIGKLTAGGLGEVSWELIDYNIHDTEMLTSRLFIAAQEAVLAYSDIVTPASEFLRDGGKRRVSQIYSPATIGKAHLDAMGVAPPRLSVLENLQLPIKGET